MAIFWRVRWRRRDARFGPKVWWNEIWNNPGLVPFRTNLTHFWPKSDISDWVPGNPAYIYLTDSFLGTQNILRWIHAFQTLHILTYLYTVQKLISNVMLIFIPAMIISSSLGVFFLLGVAIIYVLFNFRNRFLPDLQQRVIMMY